MRPSHSLISVGQSRLTGGEPEIFGCVKGAQHEQKENGAIFLAQKPQSPKKRSSPSRKDYGSKEIEVKKEEAVEKGYPNLGQYPTNKKGKSRRIVGFARAPST